MPERGVWLRGPVPGAARARVGHLPAGGRRAMNEAILLTWCFGAPLLAQASPAAQAQYDSGYFAWANGNYPAALTHFERLLGSSARDRYREPIALVTGQLYRTVPIAPDGASAQWSADGRFASFTTAGGRVTQIMAPEGDTMRTVARVDGVGLVLAPDGRHAAYFAIRETPELHAARALADSLQRANDAGRLRQQRDVVTRMERDVARLILRDLDTGQERELGVAGVEKSGLVFSPDGRSLFFSGAARGNATRADIYVVSVEEEMAVTGVEGPGVKHNIIPTRGGYLVYMLDAGTVVIRKLSTGESWSFPGTAPAVSANGTLATWVSRTPAEYALVAVTLGADPQPPVIVARSPSPLATPAPSPDGRRIAYASQPRDDWDIYVTGANGQGETRVTREIQHDRLPQWVDANRLIAVRGDARHARSFLYSWNAERGDWDERRLHHNNTIRTIAPEYEWAVSPDGTRVLVVSDRDGDTISPERGVYLLHLDHQVTAADVLERVRAQAVAERELRSRGTRMFASMQASVRAATRNVSTARIYEHERALYAMGSKHFTQPGNRLAIDYLVRTLRGFGYDPELQWFEPRPGARTANVVATLRGSANPSVVYVLSSHFDSVEGSPGADDDGSGTSALLEVARVMAKRPQPATIRFLWFSAEEAGLLGSREFVRRAASGADRIVGALNTDMVGWSHDWRPDATIRYSNDGIRDLQHAAATLFTNLITYDARYDQSTDAHAVHEAYGDIVGGFGSYPILGNPHYHQSHDVIETVNHQLVAEVARATVASIMLMASAPSRVDALQATESAIGALVRWSRSPEKGIASYVVTYGPRSDPTLHRHTVTSTRLTLPGAELGWEVAVKAVNARGLESWDWARAVVRAPLSAAGTFWNSLQDLCGRSYLGVVTQSVPPDSAYRNTPLQLHVRRCDPDEIRIPMHVGTDRSRTLVITRGPSGLHLAHEIRHPDGSVDRESGYGGDTRDEGSAIFQDFYADAQSALVSPASANAVWTLEVVPGNRFVYALRNGDRRLRVTFSLRTPVAPPPDPW